MKRATEAMAARALPTLAADANKYTRGVCELVVGCERYPGAAVLAATAANHAGAGYVHAYTCEAAACALHVSQPSIVVDSLDAYGASSHDATPARPRAVVVGCGFSRNAQDCLRTLDVLRQTSAPVVVDGGGLETLCTQSGRDAVRERTCTGLSTIITPHAGEAARLASGLAAADTVSPANADASPADADVSPAAASSLAPAASALLLAQKLGVVCVFKGPDTYIATGKEASERDVLVMDAGGPELAKAGTGDVLAGVIGSLLACGVAPLDACVAGTFVHARAGALAARELGSLGVTAEDVLAHIAPALCALEGRAHTEERRPQL